MDLLLDEVRSMAASIGTVSLVLSVIELVAIVAAYLLIWRINVAQNKYRMMNDSDIDGL